MDTNSKYVKMIAKIWGILIEYERWEEMVTDNTCPSCETSHCGNCDLKQEKEKRRKETVEKVKEILKEI